MPFQSINHLHVQMTYQSVLSDQTGYCMTFICFCMHFFYAGYIMHNTKFNYMFRDIYNGNIDYNFILVYLINKTNFISAFVKGNTVAECSTGFRQTKSFNRIIKNPSNLICHFFFSDEYKEILNLIIKKSNYHNF
jgi:hypothetical protein